MTAISGRATDAPTTDGRVLRLEGVSRTYRQGGEEVVALAPTDLSVRTGSFVAVMGPSGSGKSTMLMLVGGLAEPPAACTSRAVMSRRCHRLPGRSCAGAASASSSRTSTSCPA